LDGGAKRQLHSGRSQSAVADAAVAQPINRAGSRIERLDATAFKANWDADARLMTAAVRKIGKVERRVSALRR
jgi:hypothetical protein